VCDSPSIDVSKLQPADRQLVARVIRWIHLMSAHKKEAGRLELVAGEGKVKVAHMTYTVGRELF